MNQNMQLYPEMTEAYQKARRNYGLFSALLIAWELVGIELKEAPFQNFNITLKSPTAAPYILIALVLYFAFRFTIEWRQCDLGRRAMLASKIDYKFAHFIGIISIVIFLFQKLLDLQIADSLAENDYYMRGIAIFFGSFASIHLFTETKSIPKKWLRFIVRMIFLWSSVFVILYKHKSFTTQQYLISLILILVGIFLGIVFEKKVITSPH